MFLRGLFLPIGPTRTKWNVSVVAEKVTAAVRVAGAVELIPRSRISWVSRREFRQQDSALGREPQRAAGAVEIVGSMERPAPGLPFVRAAGAEQAQEQQVRREP